MNLLHILGVFTDGTWEKLWKLDLLGNLVGLGIGVVFLTGLFLWDYFTGSNDVDK